MKPLHVINVVISYFKVLFRDYFSFSLMKSILKKGIASLKLIGNIIIIEIYKNSFFPFMAYCFVHVVSALNHNFL